MQIVVDNLFDIIIVILSLTVIIGSFFKPTFRYVRWLVGLLVASILVVLIKGVRFFKFIETYLAELLSKLGFEELIKQVFVTFDKAYLIDTYKFDTVYNLSTLLILFIVIYVIVNLIMGISHSIKVRRLNSKGNYVYNSPIGSFILALLIVVIGISAATFTFAALPFEIDYVKESIIMSTTYNIFDIIINLIRSFIPACPNLETIVEMIAGIQAC